MFVTRLRWRWLVLLAAVLLLGGGALAVLALGGWYAAVPLDSLVPAPSATETTPQARRALASLAPRGIYVVVDSHRNRLQVLRAGEVLREAACSTGSGTVLRDPQRGRIWVFDTPLGEHRVRQKKRNPVWIKPDWAFIEEGFTPPADPEHRVDTVSLGDYALYLGDGYLIHGTLFQTLLGRKITHGCIRLGDEDLEYVYNTVPVGARVFIY